MFLFLDIAYFRELHADACTKLEQLCEVWEGKTGELEQDQDATDTNKEEGEWFIALSRMCYTYYHSNLQPVFVHVCVQCWVKCALSAASLACWCARSCVST